jgi:hypothetical protein
MKHTAINRDPAAILPAQYRTGLCADIFSLSTHDDAEHLRVGGRCRLRMASEMNNEIHDRQDSLKCRRDGIILASPVMAA